MRQMRAVLSNGATIRFATVARRSRPFFLPMDIFNHGKWINRVETDATTQATEDWAPDFSKFYNKFRQGAASDKDGSGQEGGKGQQEAQKQ